MTYTSMTDWIAEFKGRSPNPPGQSLLEKLPNELLEAILLFVKGPSDLDKLPFMIDNLPGQWNMLPKNGQFRLLTPTSQVLSIRK